MPECWNIHIEVDGREVPVKIRGPRGAEITEADRQAVAEFARFLQTRNRECAHGECRDPEHCHLGGTCGDVVPAPPREEPA